MPGLVDSLLTAPLDSPAIRLVLAAALGLFLGLEREWEQKSAGVRTFSLISLLGAVFVLLDREVLLAVGGLLVIVQSVLLAVQGLRNGGGLSLTTSASMLVAYGVGALLAAGFVLEGVVVAVISSSLLFLKRELHGFAWGLSREELRAAIEFALLAFVVFPLLPARETIRLGSLELTIEPPIVWLLVVTVAGIGIVNYAIVESYGGRGIAITGFFGGLASSTAVVGTVLDHVNQRPAAASYGIAAILLADAAMALRNLVIAVAFTVPDRPLFAVIPPLGVVIATGLVIAALTVDWRCEFPVDLDSPFSLRYTLGFGGLFFLVVVASAFAEAEFGTLGFYLTAALSGLVSSAGVTTSAVVLYRAGTLSATTATIGVLLATAASIGVKAALTVTAPEREFTLRVLAWSALLVAIGGLVAMLAA